MGKEDEVTPASGVLEGPPLNGRALELRHGCVDQVIVLGLEADSAKSGNDLAAGLVMLQTIVSRTPWLYLPLHELRLRCLASIIVANGP